MLLIAVVHEPGRNFNTIINPALKEPGDVKFPVIVGIIGMWCVGTFGAWFLGPQLKLGLFGVWTAMCADEWSPRDRAADPVALRRLEIQGVRPDGRRAVVAAVLSSVEQAEGV